jgi:hypothetical protein
LEAKKPPNSPLQLLHLLGQQGLHMAEGVDVGSNKCKIPLPHLENCSTFGVGLA